MLFGDSFRYVQQYFYNAEMNDEDLYARLGLVIGHEISHAFDSTGAQFVQDGIKCMLRLAAKKNGFDNDQFFRSFVDDWMEKGTLTISYLFFDDEHPMPYLRVNCPLQQFDQFLISMESRSHLIHAQTF